MRSKNCFLSMPVRFRSSLAALLSAWESRESLQKHIRSNDFQKILDIIDLAKEPPEIKFRTVSSIKGFELVKELRKNVKEEV
jgi:hypothetical protein